MAYFGNIGPLSFLNPGETVTWEYDWDDYRPDVMCVAGADLDRNGSADATIWATQQGRKMRIDNGPVRHEFYVTLRSDGPSVVLYNLQVATFP